MTDRGIQFCPLLLLHGKLCRDIFRAKEERAGNLCSPAEELFPAVSWRPNEILGKYKKSYIKKQ